MVQAVFIFNIFIGAVISTFDNEKEKISHNTQLTELEREYIETCIKCYKISPKKQF
jgi:translation initiation factor 2 beta subunit (eIF-2beta)/eIF-5